MKKTQPINMKIDKEIWRAVSVRAAERGIMKRELVERALTNYLNEKENNMKFEYKDLTYSYTASNYDPNFTDLTFTQGGTSYLFRNVPAPEGWDMESDWTDDEEYVMKAISDMTPEEI